MAGFSPSLSSSPAQVPGVSSHPVVQVCPEDATQSGGRRGKTSFLSWFRLSQGHKGLTLSSNHPGRLKPLGRLSQHCPHCHPIPVLRTPQATLPMVWMHHTAALGGLASLLPKLQKPQVPAQHVCPQTEGQGTRGCRLPVPASALCSL